MKFLPARMVKLSKLKLPGDMATRRKSAHVRELAASIKAHGLAHLPVVSKGKPVVGRDRLAALLELGEKTTEVREVEGTPVELEALEIAENLHRRRDDQDELRARYVALMERQLAEPAPLTQRNSSELSSIDSQCVGGQETPRGRAVKAAAEAAGVSTRAIRKSIERVEAEDPEPAETSLDSPLGAAVDEYNDAVEGIAASLRLLQKRVSDAARHATLPVAPFERVKQELARAQQINDGTRLVARCPVCDDGACSLCGGARFVTQFQLAGVPRDDAPKTLLKAPRVKRVKVELPDGTEYSEPMQDTEADLF